MVKRSIHFQKKRWIRGYISVRPEIYYSQSKEYIIFHYQQDSSRNYIYWYVGHPANTSGNVDLLHFDKTSAIQNIKQALYDFEVDE